MDVRSLLSPVDSEGVRLFVIEPDGVPGSLTVVIQNHSLFYSIIRFKSCHHGVGLASTVRLMAIKCPSVQGDPAI